MTTTMKAAVFEEPGKIAIKYVPVPTIGDDDVLIKVKYTGICGTDWSIYTGKYSSEKLPLIAGHEFSGVIEAVGVNTIGLKAGDRVTADINKSCGHCYFCRRGQKLLCSEFEQLGIHIDGSYAEFVKAPWTQVHKLPDRMNFLEGAFVEPVSCVIHNSKAMNPELGSSMAIIGAGLGILHASLARSNGSAPVIVLGHHEKRLAIAKEMGADIVIDTEKVADPVAEVLKLTSGRGADYVVESVGKVETYEQAFRMVRGGGTVSAFGITAEDDEMALRPFDVVLNEKNLTGSCAGVGNDWTEAITLIEHGRIDPRPMFSMIVPLEEIESALKELRENPDLIKVFVSLESTKREIL